MLSFSLSFLYYALPVCLAVYWLTPKEKRPWVLTVASLGFYAWGEGLSVLLLLGILTSGGGAGWLIQRWRGKKQAKVVLVASLALDLTLLGLMKYGGGLSLRPALGMSLYTLQMLGYTLEVYRGRVRPDRDPSVLILYAAGFPWLAVGPLPELSVLSEQLRESRFTIREGADGARRMVCGLAKIVLLADSLGHLCETAAQAQDPSVLMAWLYGIGAALRLYFMLSGASDLAIGTAKLFGVTLEENFDHPLAAHSLRGFWQRSWKTVGRWFGRYVYGPLAGKAPSRRRQIGAILLLWVLLGLWHGGGGFVLLWGLGTGLLLVLESVTNWTERVRGLGHVYVILTAVIGAILLAGPDLAPAGTALGQLVGWGDIPLWNEEALYTLRSFWVPLVLAAIGAAPWPARWGKRLREAPRTGGITALAEPFVLAALLVVSTAFLVSGGAMPFPYGRF